MSKVEEAVIEVGKEAPVVAKKSYEAMFEKDHPELVVPTKDAKKSDFEKALDKTVKEVVEPKEEVKKESQEVEKPVESQDVPAEEQPSTDETKPSEAEEDKSKDESADVDAKIKDYADKNGLSVDEAKAEIEEYDAIAKKYDNDPIKIAKAYKNMQSAFDKQKAQETQSQQARMVSNIMADPQAFVAKAEKENAPKWIEEYRKQFPAKSELMTDAAILEDCRQVALGRVQSQIGEYQVRLKKESDSKRESLLKNLRSEDRPYATEISRVLKDLPDVQVVDKNFNFQDITRWARGSDASIARLVKEAEERGFKKAQSGEILGEKFVAKSTTASAKPKPKENRPAGETLSAYEKKQAIERFSSIPGTDEDRYQAYIDVFKGNKK